MRRQAIERLLPAAFQVAAGADGGNNALGALLDVMELLHRQAESVLDNPDHLFAPERTGDAFVPFLARWLAVDNLWSAATGTTAADRDAVPAGRLRNLVVQATELARWRGTEKGLLLALRLTTGIDGFKIHEPSERPFHFVVEVPKTAEDQKSLVAKIVAAEKPVATTCDIIVGPATEGEPS